MTIEIKQLVIRATATVSREAASVDRSVAEAMPFRPAAPPSPQTSRSTDETLVAECVRQVLRELRRTKER